MNNEQQPETTQDVVNRAKAVLESQNRKDTPSPEQVNESQKLWEEEYGDYETKTSSLGVKELPSERVAGNPYMTRVIESYGYTVDEVRVVSHGGGLYEVVDLNGVPITKPKGAEDTFLTKEEAVTHLWEQEQALREEEENLYSNDTEERHQDSSVAEDVIEAIIEAISDIQSTQATITDVLAKVVEQLPTNSLKPEEPKVKGARQTSTYIEGFGEVALYNESKPEPKPHSEPTKEEKEDSKEQLLASLDIVDDEPKVTNLNKYIAKSYSEGTPVTEIMETYSVGTRRVYRALREEGISLRNRVNE